jgi:hypothetical protein
MTTRTETVGYANEADQLTVARFYRELDANRTSAEKVRAFRARAKAAGKCIVCGKRAPIAGLTVCKPCNESAKKRVAQGRAST